MHPGQVAGVPQGWHIETINHSHLLIHFNSHLQSIQSLQFTLDTPHRQAEQRETIMDIGIVVLQCMCYFHIPIPIIENIMCVLNKLMAESWLIIYCVTDWERGPGWVKPGQWRDKLRLLLSLSLYRPEPFVQCFCSDSQFSCALSTRCRCTHVHLFPPIVCSVVITLMDGALIKHRC